MATEITTNLGDGVEKITKINKVVINDETGCSEKIKIKTEELIKVNGNIISRNDSSCINRLCCNVNVQTETFIDPVTQQSVTISAAGIVEALGHFFVRWYNEDAPTETP